MDVLEVYEGISKAVKEVRKKSVPLFFEIRTYRYKGHSMSDPAKYRSKEELEEYKKQDPVLILKDRLISEKKITEQDYKKLDDECRAICGEAVEFAEQSGEPALEELYTDLYA